MSAIVYYELWSLPLDAITFVQQTFLESLHIAEELSNAAALKYSKQPLITAEKRLELSEGARLLQGLAKGSLILCHRLAMLRCFGLHWRIADVLLLTENVC
jgi:hypothetical protein